jgi:hypothetical protein
MPRFIDYTGRRFGRLVCRQYVATGAREPSGRKVMKWVCDCDCGAQTTATAGNLRNGCVSSCGCLKSEVTSALRKKHGMSQGGPNPRPEYEVWKGMLARCRNPHHKSYAIYGGRGIDVCQEWAEDFLAFYAHIGPRPAPEMTVERVNNDRGYEPGNVKWATRKEQRANQRRPAYV